MQTAVPTERLIRVRDAAARLNISLTYAYRLIATDQLVPVIVGEMFFVDAAEVDKLAASRDSDNKAVRTIDGVFRHAGNRCLGLVDQPQKTTAADLNKRNRERYKRRS